MDNHTIKDRQLWLVIKDEKWVVTSIVLFVFTLLFFCTKLSPFFSFNYWSDINIYFTMGKGMMNGMVPYRDLFEHKGPLMFVIYGVGYLISNDTFLGVYLIDSLFIGLGSISAYLISRHYLDIAYSFLTALIFAWFYLFFSEAGGATEDFILGLQMVSLLFFFRYFLTDRVSENHLFIQGIIASLILFMKINLLVFVGFLVLAIWMDMIAKKEYKELFKSFLMFFLGSVIVWIPILFYFGINNALADLYSGYIGFNAKYSEIASGLNPEVLIRVLKRVKQFILISPFFALSAIFGTFIFVFKRSLLNNIFAQIGLFLSFLSLSFFIFAPPATMGYYHVSLAAFSFLVFIPIFSSLKNKLELPSRWNVFMLSSIIVLGLGVFIRINYYQNDNLYKEISDEGSVEDTFAKIMFENPKQPVTLLALGLDKGLGVFTKANVVPNVKYFFHPNVYYEVSPEIRDSQDSYLENKKVDYVVITDGYRYYDHYITLEALHHNYKIVASCADQGIDKGFTYYLYKRIE